MTQIALTELDRKKLELIRKRRQLRDKLRYSFDGNFLGSRPSEKQLDCLKSPAKIKWNIAPNRVGKSATGARTVAWWFNGDHPYLERPKEWGSGSITILVIGGSQKIIEAELFEKKLKPLLYPGEWKPKREGGTLSGLVNTKNGNRIVFVSHDKPEDARKRAQAFTSAVVWLDEMPDSGRLVSELIMRVSDTRGFFIGTFTPLIENEDVYRIVENSVQTRNDTEMYVYQIADNPLFAGRVEEEIANRRAASSSEEEFRARAFGEWYRRTGRVFSFKEDNLRTPEGYSCLWQHVAICDPAASGDVGLAVVARCPKTQEWTIVKAKYLQGDAFSTLVPQVEKELDGLNVIKRWCDYNPSGFYKEARKMGFRWTPISDKTDTKLGSVADVNELLVTKKLWILPELRELIDELNSCSWHPSQPGVIKNATRYHILDCIRYFALYRPRDEKPPEAEAPPRVEFRNQVQKAEAKKQSMLVARRSRLKGGRRRRA